MSKARSPRAVWSTTVGMSDSCGIISNSRYHERGRSARGGAENETRMSGRRHEPVLPGFREMAARRRALTDSLVARRVHLGLSQTEVAARMGTSQSAVARLESGEADVRLSTL